MSYDIQIWSIEQIAPDEDLLLDEKFLVEGSGWVYRTKNWQIVIGRSQKVIDEDLPEGMEALLPGIQFVADIILEPIHAPKTAHAKLASISRKLAKSSHGVILDQQLGTFQTPAGLKRYIPIKHEERFSVLILSWWFNEGPLLTTDGIDSVLSLMESQLPEALPRRYGQYEPPQHVYSDAKRDHLLNFLFNKMESSVVWYPNRPVIGVYLFCSEQWGMKRQGFKSNYIKVLFEASVLEQPGWETSIRKFWKSASLIIQPFFGDVRTINNAIRTKSSYAVDGKTEFHPVRGPWWKGIPRKLGHAAVIGDPYFSIWNRFVKSSEIEGSLAFLSTGKWGEERDVSRLIGGVPRKIAQVKTPKMVTNKRHGFKSSYVEWNKEYPPIWPF
jgi:hypothetical protein